MNPKRQIVIDMTFESHVNPSAATRTAECVAEELCENPKIAELMTQYLGAVQGLKWEVTVVDLDAVPA